MRTRRALLPIHFELFRDEHRQRGEHTLAHRGLRATNDDGVVESIASHALTSLAASGYGSYGFNDEFATIQRGEPPILRFVSLAGQSNPPVICATIPS
jgi:hypothetical protein